MADQIDSSQPISTHVVAAASGSPCAQLESPGAVVARPLPAVPGLSIRPGVMSDIPFLDELQKRHTKQVGWMPTKQFEGKIKAGHVLIAEDERRESVGYCIGNDQYFKRDDVGIIYQMNVAPGKRRGLVGATLLKAMFDRAAYGCKLFCCWCAQDIEANHFWEAMGFVPLAFRTGSARNSRVHIFWQKRIRAGDTSTPWWFPSQTGGGSIREDRIVLPIPPGTHWSDAKPLVLPGGSSAEQSETVHALPADAEPKKSPAARKPREKKAAPPLAPVVVKQTTIAMGGLRFGAAKPPESTLSPAMQDAAAQAKLPGAGAKREKKVKQKNDPRMVAAAREMRDRWLEAVNAQPGRMLGQGKYDVARLVGEEAVVEVTAMKRLAAA